jgi:hypothetical protein
MNPREAESEPEINDNDVLDVDDVKSPDHASSNRYTRRHCHVTRSSVALALLVLSQIHASVAVNTSLNLRHYFKRTDVFLQLSA